MRTSLSDFFNKNKKSETKKMWVSDGVNYQSRHTSYYTAIEDCELAMDCIRIIQDEVIKSNPRHEIDGVTQNDEITALFRQPNFFMDQVDFLKFAIFHYLTRNNAYILKVYNKAGDIASLLPISPTSEDYLQDGKGNYFYRFDFANNKELPRSDVEDWRVIHLKRDVTNSSYFGTCSYNSKNDLLSLVNTYRILTENLKDATTATPNFIINFTEFAKQTDYDRLAKEFFDGVKKNGYGYSNENIEIKDTVKMGTAQEVKIEMIKYYQQAICNHFKVPEKILDGSANEDEYRAFYSRTIKPILQVLSVAFTNSFFTPTQQKKGHRITFAQDDISLLSHKERIELFKAVQHSSSVKIDEQRAMIGFPALEGGKGDVIMVQLDAVKENVQELKDNDNLDTTKKELNEDEQ